MRPIDYFTKAQQRAIVDAVKQAELNTSGEIRVHIERRCSTDVLDMAANLFAKLGMHKTHLRNGVLFFLSVEDRKFAILGDAGINAKAPDGFWEATKEQMLALFKEGNLTQGLVKGITMAGEKLKEHFPYRQSDINELPDGISFGG